MTAIGLLTDRHVRECIASGYVGPWLAYFSDGAVHLAKPIVNGWLIEEEDTLEAFEQDGLLGFAPPPGFWLPVATASREHGCRVVLAHQEIGETKIRTATWHADVDAWVLDGHGLCGPESALGWQPIVEVR